MKYLISFVLGSLLCANLFAGNTIEFEEYTLKNGLHVILHKDNSTPIVATTIMYHVGSKNDPKTATGAAHYVEHLMFEGSKNIERGKYTEYAEGAGGVLNANTSFDRTFYYELLPSNQLELGLWLESERMLHATMATKSIGTETQREVVMEERKQRTDNQPYGRLLEETLNRLFPEHPYRNPIGGYMEDMQNTTAKQLNDFYNTYYVPENAVLSIAGDINIKQTKKMVEKYFGSIPNNKGFEITMPEYKGKLKTGEVRDTVYDNVQLPALIQAYRVPAQGTDDFYALEMLGNVLSRGESSRLNKVIKDEKQMALQLVNIPLGLEDVSVQLAFGLPNIGVKLPDLEAAIEIEVNKLKTELISESEYQKVQNQIENDFVSNNSRMSSIAESLAQYHMYFGDANLINNELDRYKGVTREDIQEVAQKYLTKENRVVIYWLPKQ